MRRNISFRATLLGGPAIVSIIILLFFYEGGFGIKLPTNVVLPMNK